MMPWGVSVGAGVGLAVGILEARAIAPEFVAVRSRIRAEELERQNERHEAFAGIISHDSRNPLSVAADNVDLLERESDSDRVQRIAVASIAWRRSSTRR